MNIKINIAALLLCLLATICGQASAQGLIRHTPQSEQIRLPAEQQERINKLRGRKEIKAVSWVNVDFKAFDLGTVTIVTPDNITLTFTGGKKDVVDDAYTWEGIAPDGYTRARFSVGASGIYGTFHGNGKTFTVNGDQHIQLLIEMAPRVPHADDTPPGSRPLPTTPGRKSFINDRGVKTLITPNIRILTVFTYEGGAIALPSKSQVTTDQIGLMNAALSNSGVSATVTSAGYITLASSTSYIGSPSHVLASAMADQVILQARDNASADLIAVIYDDPTDMSGVQGISGWIYATPSNAFAVVKYLSLPEHSYQHELGHLFGARHQASGGLAGDIPDDNKESPVPNAHGWWVRQAAPGLSTVCYHTIMSAPGGSGPTCTQAGDDEDALYYSNPNVWYRTYPTGTSNANSALALNTTAQDLSTFHTHPLSSNPAPPPTIIQRIVTTLYNLVFGL